MKYTEEHEWLREEDGLIVVGITDYAQQELGDITFVEIPEVGKKLEADKEMAYQSQELVTFATEVDYGKLDDLKWSHEFPKEAADLFKELEFRTLLGYVTEHKDEDEKEAEVKKNYESVTTANDLLRLIS